MTEHPLTPFDLRQFTGTTNWYKYYNIHLTDGVKYFADEVGGYWVIDIIWSVQDIIQNEEFVHITLSVKDGKADITFTDGGKGLKPKVLYQQHISFTDCPIGDWNFYQCDGVIMVPSEY